MTTDNERIALTILDQLGGARFITMTGAKNLVGFDRGLRFKLPNNFAAQGINLVSVRLEDDDTYTVLFQKYRGLMVTTVSNVEHVYASCLRDVFTSGTGLDCAL